MLIKKNAQAWYTDFIIAVMVFIFALTMYYNVSSNWKDNSAVLSELLVDARYVSSSLISAGIPNDWDNNSVVRLGFTDGEYRLNETKLTRFNNISYSKGKTLLSTQYDYFFYFENKSNDIIRIGNCGFGNSEVTITEAGTTCVSNDVSSADPRELVRIDRFVVFNSSVTRMVLYLWI